jgi:hypothetical protein
MALFTPSCAFFSSSADASSCSSFSSALAISASTAPRAPRLILAESSGAEIDCSPERNQNGPSAEEEPNSQV